MAIKDGMTVTIINYNNFTVYVPTPIRTYVLESPRNGIPTMANLTMQEIMVVNSKSDAFRTGLLFFDKKQEKDVYAALNIENYSEILSNKDIEKILLNPTQEGLQRIIDIRDSQTFDRVVGILTSLRHSGNYDLSHRAIQIVEGRHKELCRNISKSQLFIGSMNNTVSKNSNESNQTLEMQRKIDELTKMVEQLALAPKEEIIPEAATVKKAGRPKST